MVKFEQLDHTQQRAVHDSKNSKLYLNLRHRTAQVGGAISTEVLAGKGDQTAQEILRKAGGPENLLKKAKDATRVQ